MLYIYILMEFNWQSTSTQYSKIIGAVNFNFIYLTDSLSFLGCMFPVEPHSEIQT